MAHSFLLLSSAEAVLSLGRLADAPLCPHKRRKWCDVPANLDGLLLDTQHVYTFHIWQHLIDFSTYKLSVGGFVNVDLTAALNGQPLQLTVFDTQVRHGMHWLVPEHHGFCRRGKVPGYHDS
eukprot:GHRQ01039457.1.p1 GENE.GHRQ01039457.1~~GHRQ01039457.1.p1  ORF type:complete len:122 (+),score=33.04 GHRQ01039457.1:235-600(+)